MTGTGWDADLFLDSDKIASHICSICRDVARDAVETICCGHIFCQWCLSKWFVNNVVPSCPCCRQIQATTVVQPSHWHRRFVSSLKVSCPKKCAWTGELKDLVQHEEVNCPLTLCLCRFCSSKFLRPDIIAHETECVRRPVACSQCHQTVLFDALADHIRDDCAETLLPCPNSCGVAATWPRCMLPTHLQFSCPAQPIACPLGVFGCHARPLRSQALRHVQDNLMAHSMAGMIRLQMQILHLQMDGMEIDHPFPVSFDGLYKTEQFLHTLFPNVLGDEKRATPTAITTATAPVEDRTAVEDRQRGAVEDRQRGAVEDRQRWIQTQLTNGTKFFHCRVDTGHVRKVEIVERGTNRYRVEYLDHFAESSSPSWVTPLQLIPWGIL